MNELESIKTLFELRLGDYAEVQDPRIRRRYAGQIIKIFKANTPRNPGEVRRLLACKLDSHRKHALKPGPVDLLVLDKGDGETYAFPRHVNFVLKYGAEIARVAALRHRCKIPGCSNWSDQGRFVGDYCAPCFNLAVQSEASRMQIRALQDLKIIEDMRNAKTDSVCPYCGRELVRGRQHA